MEVRSRRFTRFTFSFSALSVSAFSRLAPKLLNASTVQPLLSAFQLSVFSVCFPISPLFAPQLLNASTSQPLCQLISVSPSYFRFQFSAFQFFPDSLLNLSTPQPLISAFTFQLFSFCCEPWTDSSMLRWSNLLVITPSPKPICTLVFGKRLIER